MYYLPVKINARRIHVCKLDKGDANSRAMFGFIIPRVKDLDQPQLLSIDSNSARLISSTGYKDDVPVFAKTPTLSFDAGQRVLTVDLEKRQDAEKRESVDGDMPFRIRRTPFFAVLIDFSLLEEKKWKNVEFTVVMKYKEFTYSFRIYCCETGSLKEAALDFGSEASQVRISGNNANLRLVDAFKDITGDGGTDFWQGQPGDQFFKSMFFVNMNPQRPILSADRPNVNGTSTFVQALVSKNASLDDLLILPNLKLLDMLTNDGQQNVMAQRIRFDGQHEDDIISNAISRISSLSDSSVRNLVLETVLNNFLHCVLKSIYVSDSTYYFVRLVILMPNVYPQDKVYQVVSGLYKGFEKMKADYQYCKGLEVQVLSESDASFLGARKTDTWTIDGGGTMKLENKDNGYFFIIDAGKGTTDFSIMRQQPHKNSVFDSVIRGGIPISGHYITYAFYQAVSEWLNSKGIELNKFLRDAFENNRKVLCEFVDIIDEFKKRYGNFKGDADELVGRVKVWTLDAVNEELKAHLDQRLPNIEAKVDRFVGTIVTNIEKEIAPFFEENGQKFTQVMFTGRGFMFKPLRDAMEAMLKRNGWMPSNSTCLWRGDDQAKSVCMEGAFSVERSAKVNENTDLVGFPIPLGKRRCKLLAKLSALFENNNVDSDFFYEGYNITQRYSQIRIGMDSYDLQAEEDDDSKKLYFVGDDFIVQGSNSIFHPVRHHRLVGPDGIKQSLFPFYEGSIPEVDNLPAPGSDSGSSTPSQPSEPFPSAPPETPATQFPSFTPSQPDTNDDDGGLVF